MPRITTETRVARAIAKALDVASVNEAVVAYLMKFESSAIQVRLCRLAFHVIGVFSTKYDEGDTANDEEFFLAVRARRVMDFMEDTYGGV